MVSSAIVTRVNGKADLKAFIRLPWGLYRDDPNWVPPLLVERHELLDEKKNPFFDHAEVALWLARRGDRPVGRISAQVNRAHLDAHGDGAGHFGLLEAEDEGETFAALLGTAEAWLKDRGMDKIVGPFSLSINDEAGLLVDGFDTPPMILMGHRRRRQGRRTDPRADRRDHRGPVKSRGQSLHSWFSTLSLVESGVSMAKSNSAATSGTVPATGRGDAGPQGDAIRSDVWVSVELRSKGGLTLDVESRVDAYYGDSIRQQLRSMRAV